MDRCIDVIIGASWRERIAWCVKQRLWLVAGIFLGLAWGEAGMMPVLAHEKAPHAPQEILEQIGFDQRLDEPVPLGVHFRDEAGRRVQLDAYFGETPVILALGYFECPNLCSLVRVGLVDALKAISFDAGDQFEVVLVSIDPEETPAVAARVKQETLQAYDRPGAEDGWHFLTGEHDAIDRLADAAGFRYAYDGVQDQYAHASGLVLLTPEGKVARYLFGLEYEPRDLRLGLVEAARNRIGSPVDQLLLFCYHYNPTTGQYTMTILTAIRLIGLGFVLALGGAIWWMLRKETGSPAAPV